MQLHLNDLGMIPATYPKIFYRVSTWETERRVADYTNEDEARLAARASVHGGRFDHKVSTIYMTGR